MGIRIKGRLTGNILTYLGSFINKDRVSAKVLAQPDVLVVNLHDHNLVRYSPNLIMSGADAPLTSIPLALLCPESIYLQHALLFVTTAERHKEAVATKRRQDAAVQDALERAPSLLKYFVRNRPQPSPQPALRGYSIRNYTVSATVNAHFATGTGTGNLFPGGGGCSTPMTLQGATRQQRLRVANCCVPSFVSVWMRTCSVVRSYYLLHKW